MVKITDVDWRVLEVIFIDENKGNIYFYGTGENPVDRHLFVAKLDGTGITQLTKRSGWHSVNVSPAASYFYDRYSSLEDPGGAFLAKTNGLRIRDLDIKPEDTNANAGVKVEQFQISTPDGFQLPGYWIMPKGFSEDRSYPVVFSVYGGPDAGSVRNRYRSYAGDFFVNNGIIRVVMDHRASGKFGKKGMDYMHRSLGKWEIDDLIEGVKWLRQKPYIDAAKIGITGGSYGGYLTTMALTYGADYFTHGVSLFPVTDWLLYDNVYTERYMDKPSENPEGYAFGSAITHADKLKGSLLIVHGMMDDNVHMQNTMQLVSKLQDLNKDFEMMVYPGERHGWGGPKRNHLSNLTNNFWKTHFVENRNSHKMKP